MEFQLPFTIPKSATQITHNDLVILTGSCFSEHIGDRMSESKFRVLTNPQGISFNPMSIAAGLEQAMEKRKYGYDDIFLLNGIWNCWEFHSSYSRPGSADAISALNSTMERYHDFLSEAKYLMVTFGSAWQYFLRAEYTGDNQEQGVANCHKAPSAWFDKKLLPVAAMLEQWNTVLERLKAFNPGLQVLFTVSPVRHYRDGLVENNRSKARLLELAHQLCADHEHCVYFPAYELVTDVLRDYRFFDEDMVHPNHQAVQFVWEQLVQAYMSAGTQQLLKRLKEVAMGVRHKERFPGTEASNRFRESMLGKVTALQQEFPLLDLKYEAEFFSKPQKNVY